MGDVDSQRWQLLLPPSPSSQAEAEESWQAEITLSSPGAISGVLPGLNLDTTSLEGPPLVSINLPLELGPYLIAPVHSSCDAR